MNPPKLEYQFWDYNDLTCPFKFAMDEYNYVFKDLHFHWHEDLEIIYLVGGDAVISYNMDKIEAEASDIFIINSNTMHNLALKSGYVKYYYLIIQKSFCSNFDFDIENTVLMKKIRDPHVKSIFERINFEFSRKDSYCKANLQIEVLSLLLHLFKNYVDRQENSLKNSQVHLERVKKSISYIHKNFDRYLSLDEIAAYAGFSKYHFSRCFKEVTGQTVTYYINDLRSKHAFNLIKEKKLAIGEAALQSGFENLSYFTKTFKKHIGILPSGIRRTDSGRI